METEFKLTAIAAALAVPANQHTAAQPVWEAWWFWAIVILILVASAVAAHRLAVKGIEARSRALEDQVRQRTQELERGTHQIERRTQELEALNAISAVASRSLDLQEILDDALDKTLEVMDIEAGGIYLLQKDAGELTIAAQRGFSDTLAQAVDRLKVGEGFSGRVIQSGESMVVNISTDPRVARTAVREAGFGSLSVVPLVSRQKVLGTLYVITQRHREFSRQDITLLTSIGRQIGVAIDNARLFQEAHTRAEESAVLNELGQALTTRLNVEQVLDEAYRGASRLLDTTNFYIALYDPDKPEVTFAIDVTEGELRKPHVVRQAGWGLTEYILQNREPLLIGKDVPQRLAEIGVEAMGPIALSWLGVPLLIGDRVLGVMAVQSYSTPGAYDAHDRDLLTAIASPVAIAIQNARLFEETAGRARRLAVVNRIASAASATLHLDDLMETVYRETVPAFQADAFFIALYDQEARELDFRFRVDQGVREPAERFPMGVGLTSIVVAKKQPLIIGDELERNRVLTSPQLFGTMKPASSWLGAPMLVGERVIGVISVQAYRPHAWDEEDQLLLFTIADQVAVALDNARLFAEVEQRVQELQALYQADEKLYSQLNLDQVLHTLMDVATGILHADKSSLMIWDERRERLVVRAAHGFSPETMAQMSFEPGEGSVGVVAVTGEPAIVEDTHTDLQVAQRITEPEGIRSFMHVPIEIGDQIYGVFNVDYLQPRTFGDDEQRLFSALAQRAAMAIENAQLYEQAQELAVLEERQRLARDLHDAVTQTLFSASLIAEVLPALWDKDQQKGREYLEQLRQMSRGALAEMRTLLLELRPAALVEASIGDLLHQLAETVTGRTGIPVAVTVESTRDLPSDVHVAFYRIAQEALNNVVKHARASHVSVRLRCAPRVRGESVALCVSDDGEGFDPDAVSPDHLGVSIMRERAQAIGATLTIESQPGRGTQVTAEWTAAGLAPSDGMKGHAETMA